MSQHNYERAFIHHGVFLESDVDKNLVADCPFCGAPYDFRVNKLTGQWRCFKCEHLGNKGNVYTFLRLWWSKCLEDTSNSNRKALCANRGYRLQTVLEAGLAWDVKNQVWLMPIWRKNNGKRSLVNLKTWNPFGVKGEPNFKGTPTCAQHLFNSEALFDLPSSLPVIICEGEWDALAVLDTGASVPTNPRYAVVGAPGANTFKSEWCEYFAGRSVLLAYDNDAPGRDGCRMAVNLLYSSQTPPKSISVLSWPETMEGVKDVRDVSKKHGRQFVIPFIEDAQVEAVTDNLNVVRNNWSEVLTDFEAVYHVDKTFRDAATIVAATVLAARVPGEPLWLFLVGPPSTSKTVLVESFGFDREQCEMISKLTATQLVSGWKVPGSDEDVSIFPLLRSRTLLIADYTTILGMAGSVQEELYGMFREAYGGKVRIRYGNGKIVDVEDVYFSMVAAVTDVIRMDSRADLGERFLKLEVIGPEYDELAVTLAAMNGVVKDANRVRKLQVLGESIRSYLTSVNIQLNRLPVIQQEYENKIAYLALMVGHLRAVVHKNKDDLELRARVEGGGRVGKQLKKLALCLCLLLRKSQMDDEVFRLVQKAAVDTVWGFRMEICRLLSKNPEGLTTDELVSKLQLFKTNVQRLLADMQMLRIVCRTKASKDGPGRDAHLWAMTAKFGTIWNSAGLQVMQAPMSNPHQFRKAKAR